MNITFPNITQQDFAYAIECLEVCRQEHAKEYGFQYPYFTPGGAYGAQWWQLDSSLALRGYQWVDRAFAERSLWNFIESQKPNGRICLWGADFLPSGVAGGDFPLQTEDVSSLPKLFDVTYHLLQATDDMTLKHEAYGMLKRYLDWWFANRLDEESGLITAVFEETFIPHLGRAGEYAAVDTNVEVYVGCQYTEELARSLGKAADADDIRERKLRLKQSINRYLWNDTVGAYFPYFVKEHRLSERLMASTFFPLRMGIADADKQKRLLTLLTAQEHFNWECIPLTSVSMKDPAFVTTKGGYQGNASWSGNVWTLINEMVLRGLLDCGEHALAAELAVKTLRAFNHNCTEFVNPFDGSGHGVQQYAWTASQYLELLVEVIFGIRYVAAQKAVTVSPVLTEELKGTCLKLSGVPLCSGVFADVTIDHGVVSCLVSSRKVSVTISQ